MPYFDYAAATPIDPRVLDAMLPFLTQHFGNPAASTHEFGRVARDAVELARAQVAEIIGADRREIIWTSGATESNNLALKGIDYAKKSHIITAKTEHRAILDVCGWLTRNGCEVTYLDPEPSGEITAERVRDALRPETSLVSIMAVNNETGVINPIADIGALTRAHGITFHVDGAQAIGKISIDVNAMQIDLLSLSAHKAYAPKGIGALFVRRKPRVKLHAQIHGGGHERGMRSGTLATHQIVGMGKAFQLVQSEFSADLTRVTEWNQQIVTAIHSLPHVLIHGANRVPHILNLGFANQTAESLLTTFADCAVSTGSACSSAESLFNNEPSHVLKAMRAPHALSSIRVSLGRMTDAQDMHALMANLNRFA